MEETRFLNSYKKYLTAWKLEKPILNVEETITIFKQYQELFNKVFLQENYLWGFWFLLKIAYIIKYHVHISEKYITWHCGMSKRE